METYNVCQLIDLAAEQPGRRARVLRRRLRLNARFRQEFEDEITEMLATEPRALALVPAMGAPLFDKHTEFGLPVGTNLQDILDLILEWAPVVLEFVIRYILPFFI